MTTRTVNAASPLAVMALGAKHDEEVELNSDAEGAAKELTELL